MGQQPTSSKDGAIAQQMEQEAVMQREQIDELTRHLASLEANAPQMQASPVAAKTALPAGSKDGAGHVDVDSREIPGGADSPEFAGDDDDDLGPPDRPDSA